MAKLMALHQTLQRADHKGLARARSPVQQVERRVAAARELSARLLHCSRTALHVQPSEHATQKAALLRIERRRRQCNSRSCVATLACGLDGCLLEVVLTLQIAPCRSLLLVRVELDADVPKLSAAA